MAGTGTFQFADPQAFQAAVHPAQIEVFVTAKGEFDAELTRVDFPDSGCDGGARVCRG